MSARTLRAADEPRDAALGVAEVLARRRPEWRRLEAALGTAGKNKLSGRQVAELARLYRSACADLALADAYHLPETLRDYLNDLVARAHVEFYRHRPVERGRLRRLLLEEAPGRLYGDPCTWIGLATFYGSFFLSTALAAADPAVAVDFVGRSMLDTVHDMHSKAPWEEGRAIGEGGGMAAFYIQHNVGIALQSFAGGVFLGIGSVAVLLFNGLFLGAVFGSFFHAEPGTRANFFEFVTAHGPFELTGIALAGAAGLRLGFGFVATGGLTRLEGLARSARRALPMIAGAAMLVALAAPIEAFVSPSALPLWSKRAVAVVCTLLVLAYLVVAGRRAHLRAAAAGAP